MRNAFAAEAFDFQFTLPNGTRADCVLRLPNPPACGDRRFKVSAGELSRMFATDVGELERRAARQQPSAAT